MTIVRFLLSTAALGLAVTVAQPSMAQKRRPLPGAPKAGPGGKMKRPLPGAPGGPGGKMAPGKKGGPDGAGPPGKRVAELKQKEKAGTLTGEEKAELSQMKQRRMGHRMRRQARQARLAELGEKKKSGTLTDQDKAELEKLQKFKQRHQALKKKYSARAQDRAQRRRAARRKAMKEFPGLAKNEKARAEYGKHGNRMAKLERAREVAEAEERNALVGRIDKLMEKEKARHQKWVEKHKAAAQQKGGER